MMALLDNGQDLDQCAAELGCEVGQLLTPLTRYRLRAKKFAIDNGGFVGFEKKAFLALLKREESRKDQCLFVAMPDIVGSARRTLEVFDRWRPRPELEGWKVALVCQDGQEDLPLPWDEIDAVFIGGSTNWKCGPPAEHIIRAAKALDKHVHIGRVNTPMRWDHFEKLGADTCDGNGIGQRTHMREAVANRHLHKELFP